MMEANKEMNFVSAVVYLRNNQALVTEFLNRLLAVLSTNFAKFEIIFVDDASEDESAALIRKAAGAYAGGTVQIIHMSHYQGSELAMNAGLDLAIGDFVFEFDAVQLNYPASVIMEVYHRSLTGFDIVSAAPAGGEQNRSSKWFYRLYNRFSQNQYELKTESFRILSRRVINRIHSMSKTVPYRKALYINCGLKQDTIFYQQAANDLIDFDGQMREYRLRTAMDVLILFTDIGYKTALWLTMGMIGFSILTAIYSIFIFLTRQPILGWTSTVLFLSLGFAGIFAVAAIIIKYLDIIMGLIFKKKAYLIDSIEKLK